jgi:protein arginine kinase activator
MKCHFCQDNEAVIHIKEFSEQGVRKINLCMACAAERGLDLAQDNVDQLLIKLLKNIVSNEDKNRKSHAHSARNQLKCPGCGATVYTLMDTRLIGCSSCFITFEKYLDRILFRTNNSLTYEGSYPARLQIVKEHKRQIVSLKREMKLYLSLEDYRKAAAARDRIKELKKELKKLVPHKSNQRG